MTTQDDAIHDNIPEPAFVIYPCTGPIPEPPPPPPPPSPPRPEPTDEFLSSHFERRWEHAVARPVYVNRKPTGEWLVSGLRNKYDWSRRWVRMPDRDHATEWCMKVDDLWRTK